jgi:hypothetical protein
MTVALLPAKPAIPRVARCQRKAIPSRRRTAKYARCIIFSAAPYLRRLAICGQIKNACRKNTIGYISNMKSFPGKSLWLSLIFIAGAAAARGQVILSDNFSTGTPSSQVTLDGQSPTYPNPTTETWTSNTNITTDGSEAVLPNLYTNDTPYAAVLGYIGIPSAYLTSSDLVVGTTYSLSLTVSETSGGGGVAYAGFGTVSQTSNVPYQNGNEGSFYVFDNGIDTYVADSDVANDFTLTRVDTGTGANPVSIVLDITAGAGDIDLLTATIDKTQVFSTTAKIFPSADVFISDLTTDGTVSDLSLSVPEPSTYVLLLGGLALVGVCVRGRRAILA